MFTTVCNGKILLFGLHLLIRSMSKTCLFPVKCTLCTIVSCIAASMQCYVRSLGAHRACLSHSLLVHFNHQGSQMRWVWPLFPLHSSSMFPVRLASSRLPELILLNLTAHCEINEEGGHLSHSPRCIGERGGSKKQESGVGWRSWVEKTGLEKRQEVLGRSLWLDVTLFHITWHHTGRIY